MSELVLGTVLYGMMESGKSTLGKGLATHLGQTFTDTDELIEHTYGMTCGDIIRNPELDFGRAQSLVIVNHTPSSPEVIATGGSVVMYPEVVSHLKIFGVGVFIDVDPEALEARISPERIAALNNPKGLSFVDLYEERRSFYKAAADLVLKVPGEQMVDATLANLIDLRQSIC